MDDPPPKDPDELVLNGLAGCGDCFLINSTALCGVVKDIPEEVRRVTSEQEVDLFLTTQKDAQQLKLQDGKHRDATVTKATSLIPLAK